MDIGEGVAFEEVDGTVHVEPHIWQEGSREHVDAVVEKIFYGLVALALRILDVLHLIKNEMFEGQIESAVNRGKEAVNGTRRGGYVVGSCSLLHLGIQ
jgi:hypothetical protein